jgi:hypothetical protein
LDSNFQRSSKHCYFNIGNATNLRFDLRQCPSTNVPVKQIISLIKRDGVIGADVDEIIELANNVSQEQVKDEHKFDIREVITTLVNGNSLALGAYSGIDNLIESLQT